MRHAVVVLILLAFPASATLAQDRDNVRYSQDRATHWSFEFGGATDNRSKGASKSAGEPYVFGEVQWNAASGFYADLEFETIDSSGAVMETEAEAGWQFTAGGFDFDTSTSHKWRLGAEPGHDDAAWEFQFDAMRDFGRIDGRLRVEYSPDGLGSTGAWTWTEGRVRWPVVERVQASVTLGRREQDNGPDYTGWNAGVSFAATRTFELDLRWHDTSLDGRGGQYDAALVAGVLIGF